MVALATRKLRRAARVILVGAPGVGKGTQAERLMQRFPQLTAVSSGDLLRNAVMARDPIGVEAESYMRAGALVPDATILKLILSELQLKGWVSKSSSIVDREPTKPSDEPSASFILDGFPRTAAQAAKLDALIPVNLVVSLITPVRIILDRIANRWIHAPSGRVYNVGFNNPKVAGKDDLTGEPLMQRDDDNEETWKNRLAKFNETSSPLLEYYGRKGICWEVEGNSSDQISPKLFAEFERRFC